MVAVTTEDFDTDPEKTVFVRVVVEGLEEGMPRVTKSGSQSSNVLSAAAAADAFAVVPRGVGTIGKGDSVTIEMFKWPASRERVDGR
jgi:molybdopterin biosynthesis enzyme